MYNVTDLRFRLKHDTCDCQKTKDVDFDSPASAVLIIVVYINFTLTYRLSIFMLITASKKCALFSLNFYCVLINNRFMI